MNELNRMSKMKNVHFKKTVVNLQRRMNKNRKCKTLYHFEKYVIFESCILKNVGKLLMLSASVYGHTDKQTDRRPASFQYTPYIMYRVY